MSEEWNNSNPYDPENADGMNTGDGIQGNQTDIVREEAAAGSPQSTENTDPEPQQVTYSWVNPKIRKESDSSAEQDKNPWNAETTSGTQERTGGYSDYSSGYSQAQHSDSGTAFNTGSTVQGEPADSSSEQGRKHRGFRKKHDRTQRQKRSRRPMTTGKRWTLTVAMAVVFGLVAGLVFQAVNLAGNKMTGKNTQTIQIPTTSGTQNSDDSQASADSGETQIQNSQSSSAAASGGTVASVAEKCMPSLVTISTISVEEMQSFFGGTQQYEVEGAGTGVIVGQNDTELLIATNNHVVQGATSVSVGFIDETAVEASIKGTDSDNDLAVVAVNLDEIPEETSSQIAICALGNSDDLVLGEQVVAIGNALGYGQSVTSGYISAFDRSLSLEDNYGNTIDSTGLIQTDASINAGNSGGALLNMNGELIGINEAKSSSSGNEASVDNIGFAIPIAKAEPILENLMSLTTRDKVSDDEAAYLGITCADVNSETAEMYGMPTGVCLTSVIEGGPAETAGLKKGDILTSFDGRNVSNYEELTNILQYYAAGETIDVTIQRSDDGEYVEHTFSVTLGNKEDMPSEYQSSDSDESDDSNSDESQNDESQSDDSQQFGDGQQGFGIRP